MLWLRYTSGVLLKCRFPHNVNVGLTYSSASLLSRNAHILLPFVHCPSELGSLVHVSWSSITWPQFYSQHKNGASEVTWQWWVMRCSFNKKYDHRSDNKEFKFFVNFGEMSTLYSYLQRRNIYWGLNTCPGCTDLWAINISMHKTKSLSLWNLMYQWGRQIMCNSR